MDMNAAGFSAPPLPIRREDYRPPDWLVPEIALDFDLDPAGTVVRARLAVTRNGSHDRPLRLDGDALLPLSVAVDGETLGSNRWRLDGDALVVGLDGDSHVVETVVEIAPEANSQLMGLYASGGILCTQCEAEGFRRITFFPDRPDVLSRYRVTLRADKATFPVLLSNGDLVAQGEGEGGRHWAEWHDPFPKPSYLFAAVAGDLSAARDRFVTASGREVQLAIWVREADLPRTAHAMAALKDAMAWDERAYGREYDLGVFNIVAVADFNFGAMENKGLNIFNSRYILADAQTATDADFDGVATVVAHEYFHNWSGNRVTCRDWFQLSLKEGFTVLRDQQFTADHGSPAVARIEQVRSLRAGQFPEDAGPLAHPVRPESYLEISNFYTSTIYNKGAEVIRMMRTVIGPENFRRGSDLYFDRHDGTAATCEDFVRAMEEASGADLTQFRRWYTQAGTPHLGARLTYEAETRTARLTLTQSLDPTPGQPDKLPMLIPVKMALFAGDGGASPPVEDTLMLAEASQEFVFENIDAAPVLSINRGFSAPLVVDAPRGSTDLAFLSAHETDPFARYEALQQLMLEVALASIDGRAGDTDAVVATVGDTLARMGDDPAFAAEAVLVPSEAFIGERLHVIDPDAVHAAREALIAALATRLTNSWDAAYRLGGDAAYVYSPRAKGLRRLRNIALGFLAKADPQAGAVRARAQYEAADNMTDRMGALTVLANGEGPERDAALADFHDRYRDDPLVIDKWFTVQALSTRDDTAGAVEALSRHPDFALTNPNRIRALVSAFAANPRAFHAADGAGYRFLSRMILAVDKLNPQTAAKLVPPLGRWKRYDEGRAALMRGELETIVATPGLSKDVFEQASKSLGAS
jgi:aminopeptidase N